MKCKAHLTAFIALFFCILSCARSTTIKTELYFGLSNADGNIPYEDWNTFRSKTVDNLFDGYTVLNGEGYWKSAGKQFHENCIVLVYIHEDTTHEDKKIDSVIYAYKRTFKQESVLRTDQPVNAVF